MYDTKDTVYLLREERGVMKWRGLVNNIEMIKVLVMSW